MQIDTETLDQQAQRQWLINQALMSVAAYLRDTNAPQDIQDGVDRARDLSCSTQRSLIRVGATDPILAVQADTRRRLREEGFDAPEPDPFALPAPVTETMRVFARAMREAAELAQQVDAERGVSDGRGEMMDDFAWFAELEAFGAVGVGGE